MTKEEFCKELKESQEGGILSVCSTGQKYINSLEAENERLKKKIAAYEDERKCLSETITCDATVIHNLNKENAKLKCLALHLFERVAFHEFNECSEILDYLRETSSKRSGVKKNRDRWWRIYTRCGCDYHKAKKELKEGK